MRHMKCKKYDRQRDEYKSNKERQTNGKGKGMDRQKDRWTHRLTGKAYRPTKY
jgi:hypothetical protein